MIIITVLICFLLGILSGMLILTVSDSYLHPLLKGLLYLLIVTGVVALDVCIVALSVAIDKGLI